MSDQAYRLAEGGRIDRARRLDFTFDGRALSGFEGDTLASALLANGIHFVARSFKYHRPRGIFAAGLEEPNALVAVNGEPRLDTNSRATDVELKAGLAARSINSWPSLDFDIGALGSVFHRFLPAAFYYKTFMWPNWGWFEGAIRRAAGLGDAPRQPDPDRYERMHRHCEVLVVGGGPAGLGAALEAARAGEQVILAEQDGEFGGSLLWTGEAVDGRSGLEWTGNALRELAGLPNVTLLPRTIVAGYYDHNYLTAVERLTKGSSRQRISHIRAKRVVLATGAIERPLPFPDNDRPGIMLASAVRHYLNRYAVAAGRRVLVFANNDSPYDTAFDLRRAGIEVAAIVDVRDDPGAVAEKARSLGLDVLTGSGIARTFGGRRVTAAEIVRLSGGPRERVHCDVIAMGGGWSPAVHLFSQSGGKLRYDGEASCFLPHKSAQAEVSIGAAAGEGLSRPAPLWETPRRIVGHAKQWIDFHNDVTNLDVALAARENFVAVEHLKRYTTLGMATDQGKTSNVNGLALMAEITGRSIPEVGTTTFRPPYAPISFGVIAGRQRGDFFHPHRLLPTNDLQKALGAEMEEYGPWLRPAFYASPGEDEEAAVRREVLAVRRAVGILDYSPLGKIEVRGPDALEFLNRLVLTNLATLKAGKTRYTLTLNEMGIVIDDGVITRLDNDHFLVGTTSGAAQRIALMFEEWRQCEWPHLKVFITNVTTAWGVIMISGPKARELLSRADPGIDLSPEAFPHMAYREGRFGDVPARIHRVSFTGEVSYEIAVPTGYTAALWELLMELGRDLGITPIGLESLMVLRTEKGFLHVGSDTDGTTVPNDIGFGPVAEKKPMDFVGKRSLSLVRNRRPDRLQLVGLESGLDRLPVGAHLLSASVASLPADSEGHVTSSCWSPALGRPVALGLLAGGRAREGEVIRAYADGRWITVTVVAPRFYDPEGSRLNA